MIQCKCCDDAGNKEQQKAIGEDEKNICLNGKFSMNGISGWSCFVVYIYRSIPLACLAKTCIFIRKLVANMFAKKLVQWNVTNTEYTNIRL